MQTHIIRWRDSLGIRIPENLARQLGMTEGTVIDITAEADRLVLKTATPSYSLDQLLEGMTPDAMQQALHWERWSDDVGREDVG